MIIKKYKQNYIFDDGKNIVQYDIENDKLNGNVRDNLLMNMKIEESEMYFEDENVWFMFRDIAKKEECKNIGSVVHIMYNYKNFEQIYSAGLKVFMTPSEYGYNGDFGYTIKEIPKGLRKICKENNIYLNNQIVETYMQNPDIYNMVYSLKDNYRGLKKTNLKTITEAKMRGRGLLLTYLHDHFRYDIKTLMEYFDYLKVDLKMRNVKNMMKEYSDYVAKASVLNERFEKYPKNFIEEYENVLNIWRQNRKELNSKKAKKLREERQERENAYFKNNIKHEYEIEYKDYIFIYPRSAGEIREEGRNNHNCVATYIDSVIEKSCDIMFLRKKDFPEKSLVTLEIRNGKIVQARRVCNSAITDEDKEAIMYFNNMFGKCEEFIDNDEEFEDLD